MTTTHPVTQLSPGQFLPSWMARTASEPSSWGEYLKQYEKNRCQPCTLAVPRTKAAQDSRHNREFDIILQRYRDLTKEEHFRRRSEEKRQAHMEAAMVCGLVSMWVLHGPTRYTVEHPLAARADCCFCARVEKNQCSGPRVRYHRQHGGAPAVVGAEGGREEA
eukprot:1037681-Amorphochlora_amoeboformis.AAC.2